MRDWLTYAERNETYVKGVVERLRKNCFTVTVRYRGAVAWEAVAIGNRGRRHALQQANLLAIEFHLLLGKPLTSMVLKTHAPRSNTGLVGVHRMRGTGALQVRVAGDVAGSVKGVWLPPHTSEAVAELVRAVMYEEAIARRPIRAAHGAGAEGPALW